MTDELVSVARRLGVSTHTNAGPGDGLKNGAVWASWPRHSLEIAHDMVMRIVELDGSAGIEPAGRSNMWRAYRREWSAVGTFTTAVTALATRVLSEAATRRNTGPATYATHAGR